MELSDQTMQTLLGHIQAAVSSGGVPVATLVEMLANLPASVGGPFPPMREIVESVVRHFSSVLFVDAYDKVQIRSEDCQGAIKKCLPSSLKNLNTNTCLYNVKGRMLPNELASDAGHVKRNNGDSRPACNAAYTSTVPHADKEQLSGQVGVIHSLHRNGGIITFGSEGTERAFFSRSSVSEMLVRAKETMGQVFHVGDRVCLNVRRNHDPRKKEKWEATSVATVLYNTRTVVLEDYTEPPRPVFKSHTPETSLKPSATSSETSDVGNKLYVSAQHHFSLSKQEKCQLATANTDQHGASSNVCSAPNTTAAAMEGDRQKMMPFNNARKKCTVSLNQRISVEFSKHRKLSSYTGTFHAESETMGHVRCHKDGTVVLVLIDVVYCHGKKIEHFCELSGKSTLEEETDVFVDAVETKHVFWLATLVWAGERPARPHVNRSEDIFASVLDSVKNAESAKGNSPVSLRRRLDTCQRCRSAPAYDAVYTGSCYESRVETTGQLVAVGQVQEPRGHPPTAYPSSDNAGIVHCDVASSDLQPCAVVEPAHGSLFEETNFTIADNMMHPPLVDVATPCIAVASGTTEFQGSICYGSANASAGRPAACYNIPGSRRIETSSSHEENSNITLGGGGGDAERCELENEEMMQWISAAVRDGIQGIVYEELHKALAEMNIIHLPDGVDLAAPRSTPCPDLADNAASLTRGSTSAVLANTSSRVPATFSGMP